MLSLPETTAVGCAVICVATLRPLHDERGPLLDEPVSLCKEAAAVLYLPTTRSATKKEPCKAGARGMGSIYAAKTNSVGNTTVGGPKVLVLELC